MSKKRSLSVNGHRTSISLEDEFWMALRAIAKEMEQSVDALVSTIRKQRSGRLSSAVRVFVLEAQTKNKSA